MVDASATEELSVGYPCAPAGHSSLFRQRTDVRRTAAPAEALSPPRRVQHPHAVR